MQPTSYYHIYNHANGDENLFREEDNYRFFLSKWTKYIEPIAETYAYCLMPNHFHVLIRTKETSKVFENLGGLKRPIEKVFIQHFSNLFNAYTKAFNKKYNRKGSLFIPNFKSKEITSDSYLTNIIFYIHHNPVHHGFTQSIEDWPHSSYHTLIGDKLTRIKRDKVRSWFGNTQELKKFHNQSLKQFGKMEKQFVE